jgi:16S rRNA (uracil1498-N3)-methyltransferase
VSGAFFVEPADVDGDRLVLVDDEAHHVRVRRHREGDLIDVIDGVGCAYRVRVGSMAPKRVEAEIVESRPEWGESPVCLHLAVAVPKGSRFDLVVEKGTEVGVASIVPMLTERGLVRPDREGQRVERWRRLARSAAKQCGRSRVPRIGEPVELPTATDELARRCGRLLVADAQAGEALTDALQGGDGPVALFIGPEGGFEPTEWTALKERGARPFTWGERTLRAETAAVVLSALVLDTATRQSVTHEEGA